MWQIKSLTTLKVASSIVSVDSNITDNVIRKVINVEQEICGTKDGALRNTNINLTLLRILPIQNNLKLSITKKWRNKAKNPVVFRRRVQLHLHTLVHAEIDLGEQNIARSDKFYIHHTIRVTQDVVFKGNHYIFSRLFFFYWSLFLYFSLPILVFLPLLLTHFFQVIFSIELLNPFGFL